MKKILFSFFIVFLSFQVKAQIHINAGVDTTDVKIKNVVNFYVNYINEFKSKTKLPDFSKYWNLADCKKYNTPDPSVYGIGGDYPTYLMGRNRTIQYVKPLKNNIFNH